MQNREHAVSIYKTAVAAVQPSKLLPQYVEVLPVGIRIADTIIQTEESSLYVIGAGKAAAGMAQTVASILGDRIKTGLVVTKYEHTLPLAHINIIESGHPVPDEKSVAAVQQTIALLKHTKPGDVILCLLSGGASSLWADLPEGCNLDELQRCFQLLLKSGAAIEEMNCVRRHLSSIKGGQLLRYAPLAEWHTLIISDVPGDQLEAIASGPTAADPSSFSDAWKVIESYQLQSQLPASVLRHFQKGLDGSIKETVKENDPLLLHVRNHIIGSNRIALEAAGKQATALGYSVVLQEELLTGDAAHSAASIMEQAKKYKGKRPACLLFGGEATVLVTGSGKGGRNQHLALCALQHMDPTDGITLLAAGTDGTDGPTDAAGAFADRDILLSIEATNIVIQDVIQENDAFHFFEDVKGLLKTGATQTNVMDILIVLLD